MVKKHSLFKIRTASGDINSLCLRLVLSRPPLCYLFVVDISTIPGNLSMTSMLLRGVNQNSTIWDRNPDACLRRDCEGYWDRTTDPSFGSAFGHCLIYDLVIDEVHGTKLVQKLHELSMFRTTPIGISGELLRPEIERLDAHDWSGGVDVRLLKFRFRLGIWCMPMLLRTNLCLNFLLKRSGFALFYGNIIRTMPYML